MRVLGAHMSTSGGLWQALDRGARDGCNAIQIFTRNNNRWKAKPLDDDEIDRFSTRCRETGIEPVLAHGSYLINLATPDADLMKRSIGAFGEELERCARLGIPALVAHPGAHMGSGEGVGCGRVASALDAILESGAGAGVRVLLETTAGQGTSVGHRFEHLRDIIGAMRHGARVGICVDTCHVFAAGYDIRTRRGYDAVMEECGEVLGLDSIGAFHLNDSLKDIGCRVDRHQHIGRGFIGLEPFRGLMNDPRFDGVPMILETPKGMDGAEDRANLALLRGLGRSRRHAAGRLPARRGAAEPR